MTKIKIKHLQDCQCNVVHSVVKPKFRRQKAMCTTTEVFNDRSTNKLIFEAAKDVSGILPEQHYRSCLKTLEKLTETHNYSNCLALP